MLVESNTIRALLDARLAAPSLSEQLNSTPHQEKSHESGSPGQSSISMNPIPALVICLLGVMMSSHTQDSMVSTMIHKQWGSLLTGSSLARILTTVLIYIKPPRSALPSRPPTELLTSFGLIAGGILLMASVGFLLQSVVPGHELTFFLVYRYRGRHGPFRFGCYVLLHGHYGVCRPSHVLGHSSVGTQRLGAS